MSHFNSLPDKFAIRLAYMQPEAMQIRQRTFELYSDPQINFPEWVLTRQNGWRGDELILDISPGSGAYFELARQFFPKGTYIAADSLPQLLQSAQKQPQSGAVQWLLDDIETLPFPDHSFDIILANQMLYHLPDLYGSIMELHRVLKPTGLLIATTHSQYTMAEFDTLTRRALTLLGHPPRETTSYYGRFIENFSLENGAMLLGRYFRAVARHEIPTTLIFKDSKPAIEYLNGSRAIREMTLPTGVSWNDFLAVMDDQVRRLISHFGELAVNCLSGVLLATDGGGFSREYFAVLDKELQP